MARIRSIEERLQELESKRKKLQLQKQIRDMRNELNRVRPRRKARRS